MIFSDLDLCGDFCGGAVETFVETFAETTWGDFLGYGLPDLKNVQFP